MLDVVLCSVRRVLLVTAISSSLGCTVVGTGTRTIIKAEGASDYAFSVLPGYLVSKEADQKERVVVFDNNVEIDQPEWLPSDAMDKLHDFDGYLKSKYGISKPRTALLSAEIRDLGRVPAFSPTLQAMAAAEVLKIMTQPSVSPDDKLKQKDLLLSSFLNVPQSLEIKTLNARDYECELYYYYPHIEVDLSADVLSPSINDRFSEIILLIHIDNESFNKGVRLVNFLPKDTDIAEFSRGIMKESTEAQMKGTYGLTRSIKSTNVSGNQTTESSVSPSLGGEVSLTYSEGLERDLKEAIEKKTTGIVQNGQTFIADLRALRNVRIGGSYRFDLLLEVPAKLNVTGKYCVSVPVVSDKPVGADVVIAGVVRHVEDLGRTGIFHRVPEAENDDVYEEVVLHEIPAANQVLWQYNNIPAVRQQFLKESNINRHTKANKKKARK